MNFNRHSNLEGQHAFLGASKYHWINYTDDKIADSYVRFLATQKGTVLHAFAAQCILLGQKLPKSQKTLNMYVNDAIGYKMTPEQILSAIVDEIKRKFLTKTARSQKQSILFFRDPFKLVPVDKIAEMTDKFTRNEVMTSNEIRQKIGMKPSSDPKADELRNSNLSAPAESTPASTPKEDNNQNGEET